MTNLILHHYAMSPFSQKVRSMLGYTQQTWHSVIVREMPPRPLLATLAGGYRKIPVAQDGADVFCDTRVIAGEIAQRSGRPGLAPTGGTAEQQAWAARVDLDMFFACLISAGGMPLARKAAAAMSVADLLRFVADRVRLGRGARVRTVGLRQARPAVLAHLAQMEAMLEKDFLFGDAPLHADFSAWHSLWFLRDLGESSLPDGFPRVLAWMDRMRGFGEGVALPMTAQDALAVARAATPRAIAAEHRQDARIGSEVRIAPADYGRDPASGTLVGVTPTRWIIARHDPAVGTVHVHFPQAGFRLDPVDAAGG